MPRMAINTRRHFWQMEGRQAAVRIVILIMALASCAVGYLAAQRQQLSEPTAAAEPARHLAVRPVPELGQPGALTQDPEFVGPPVEKEVPNRMDLAALAQEEGFTVGVELGVQEGRFSRHNLDTWPGCQKYHLVDLWKKQENYMDLANVPDDHQEAHLQACRNGVKLPKSRGWSTARAPFRRPSPQLLTKETESESCLLPQERVWEAHKSEVVEPGKLVEPHRAKVVEHRMSTIEAASAFADSSVDFIYVDARHDYCGVKEDVEAYWPKLRPGGIMAGHDYLDAAQVKAMTPEQDWSRCGDGRIVAGAVRQAVDEFAEARDLIVTVTYWKESWPSWIVRKPA